MLENSWQPSAIPAQALQLHANVGNPAALPSRGLLEACRESGAILAILGWAAPKPVRVPFLGPLMELSQERLGGVLGHLGAIFGRPGASFRRLLGCLLGRLGGRPSKNARTLKAFTNREKIIAWVLWRPSWAATTTPPPPSSSSASSSSPMPPSLPSPPPSPPPPPSSTSSSSSSSLGVLLLPRLLPSAGIARADPADCRPFGLRVLRWGCLECLWGAFGPSGAGQTIA